MSLSAEDVRTIVTTLITLILSIAVHEFGHAYVACRLGDPTPERDGRVTLNPLVHADPIGTFLFPVIGLVMTAGHGIGFGWGRPVMINPVMFTRKLRMRTGHLLVAAAGPMMNILFGTLICVIHVVLFKQGILAPESPLHRALFSAVSLNYILAFFNLIPAPPLDGGAVLEGLLPEHLLPGFRRFAVYGPFVLMAVIFIPQLQMLFVTPAVGLWRFVYGLMGIGL